MRSSIMKIAFIMPLAAALMLSGAALAQEQTAPPAATPDPALRNGTGPFGRTFCSAARGNFVAVRAALLHG
jgi:hypothetical protein